MSDSELLVNLVVALVAGLAGALIAVRLRQSVILGYIVAGIAIGPNTPGFVGDIETVEALAEIGVILLMFAIGIQFSLRDLLGAGVVATLGSTVQVVLTIAAGAAVGLALGWDPLEAVFFGAVISNSSSTVLSKVLGERGELDSTPGRLALAWSTVQDLGTVILIVLLSALATESDSLLLDLLIEVGKAAAFLIVLVPIGLRVLPWIFGRVAELRNREVFVLTVAVIALGLAYSASFFGLSLALGAFVAGVVVAESELSHQILGEVLPLRDIFAGLFFVSVGMLVDPGFVIRNLPLLAVTLALIILVKGTLVAVTAGLLGTPTSIAIMTGAILAQCAEFSFLLARVGRDVDAVSSTVFGLMLAAAAASIVIVPGVYLGSRPIAAAASARRPFLRANAAPWIEPVSEEQLRGHAIICGYGRVGRVVGALVGRRFPIVVIEEDPRIVRRLQEEKIPVVLGSAATVPVLEQVNPARARLMIVALPDPVQTRQIVAYARERYPHLDMVVRTHSEDERRHLLQQGVNEVVLGEWETALEMTRHALHRFGVSTYETQELIHRMRGRITIIPEEESRPAVVRRRRPRWRMLPPLRVRTLRQSSAQDARPEPEPERTLGEHPLPSGDSSELDPEDRASQPANPPAGDERIPERRIRVKRPRTLDDRSDQKPGPANRP